MNTQLLAGLVLALTTGPALAERVYFNDFEAEGVGGTKINQRSLQTVDVNPFGRVDVITDVNRFGYAPRTTFLDLGGGLIGGGVSPRESFAFKAGDRITVSFDASGNQLRPNSFDYFTFEYDITTRFAGVPDPENDIYNGFDEALEVSEWTGTGAFEWLNDSDPYYEDDRSFLIYERAFAGWGYPGFSGPQFPGDFPWTPSSVSIVAQADGRIDFELWTIFGGYGPLIDNLAIDITPTGFILEPCERVNPIERPESCGGLPPFGGPVSTDLGGGFGMANLGYGPVPLRGLSAPFIGVAQVPTPGSMALFGLGLVGLGALARRRR